MKISDFSQIREKLGEPRPVLPKKIYSHLNPQMRDFIQRSPLVFIATVDSQGFPTISPKGDAPGFVKQQNDHTLLIPERKGNKMAITFSNILAGSPVGLLFVVPRYQEVLRLQGTCEVLDDEQLNHQLASSTQSALLVTRFTLDHGYFHCGKAFLRSQLFKPETWGEAGAISFAEELAGNAGIREDEKAEFDSGVAQRYRDDL